MKGSSQSRLARVLKAVRHYLVFLALVAFLTTCCMMLFVTVLSNSLGVEFTNENIEMAAKLTFGNVVLISLLVTVADIVRRRLTIDRTVKHITTAANRMMHGNFDVRIETGSRMYIDDGLAEIIECLNDMAGELSSLEALRTDFVANVTHEMKTPLSAVQNYATLLSAPGLDDAERMEYARSLLVTTRRLSQMITNMLKLNKIENQKIFPKPVKYNLGEQLCECLIDFENVWESKNIGIETDITEDITVSADPELLSLVWNNLFSNAFKFTESGGTVKIFLSATDRYATVTVEDTGCGMSPEVGARIFEKFYQGDTSRATEGNGLGLALVKRVIDIVEGDISVKSEKGIGTSFTVRIKRG